MDNRYVWAIEDIYKDETEWENDRKKAEEMIPSLSEYKGKLFDAENFAAYMKRQESIARIIDKLYVYAMMLHDSDTANSNYDSLLGKAMALSVSFSSATSFDTPELTALPEETINGFIKNEKLKDYDYQLKLLRKRKKQVLTEGEEKILAECGETFSSFKEIFTKIDNADLPLKTFKYKGQEMELSHGLYSVYMQSEDRALRKKCFTEYYKAYVSLINVISATYYGNVKKNVLVAKTRKYNSTLEMALSGEDVNPVVYKNLIKSVNKSLPLLHRYMREKKKALGLKSAHMYDVYVPTVKGADLKLDYDKAYELVMEGLSPLGKDYVELLKKAYDERWLDVNEKKGKRSGAYSVAVFDTHPYVLLNYQKTTHDVFTIAHEMGHSIHSYYSNKAQPYFKADYKIFVAEVASTVNEVLLLKHLLKTAKDDALKKYLLSYLMEMIRTTLFRQTQFAEFEEYSHGSVEKGEPLTTENMNAKYLELNKKYYGRGIISDNEIQYEWARIPHFYSAFYVYKYATGIISALAIADRILKDGETAVNDYKKFLSSGGSDSPVELLKIAGVDLTKKEPFDAAFLTFKNALDEFSKL
ncbi:MAG: oligoendopeptidase F [Clostridia bacterium]|nr:oligoendopeptidase F [Clostridia bacterium]